MRVMSLPRRCRFLDDGQWAVGVLHSWAQGQMGSAIEPVGIVEDAVGDVHSVSLEYISLTLDGGV